MECENCGGELVEYSGALYVCKQCGMTVRIDLPQNSTERTGSPAEDT